MNPVVLCGSGPSLNSVPWDRLPYPKAAINRAALLPGVDFECWFMLDARMEHILAHPARELMADESIIKVLPAYKKGQSGLRWIEENGRNLLWAPVSNCHSLDRRLKDRGRVPFDGQEPMFKLHGLTFTFALQWLTARHSDVILAGCDLTFEGRAMHFDGKQHTPSAMSHETKSLEDAYRVVATFWPHVEQRGKRWWRIGGGRLAELLPEWSGLAPLSVVG